MGRWAAGQMGRMGSRTVGPDLAGHVTTPLNREQPMSRWHRWILSGALVMVAAPVSGQSLAQRARNMGEGIIRFSYAAREGVCGRGGEGNISVYSRSEEWESDCEAGPVRISAQVEDGRVVRLRTYVGGRWRGTGGDDLGVVGVREAVSWLEALAVAPGELRGDAIFPMTIADSITPWDALLRIAKSPEVASRTRQSALFWLGQGAGAAATAQLEEVAMSDEDRKMRDQAVFALSQLRDGAGVDALIRLARTNDDPKTRRTALFWLGQSKDPRVLALFEEILLGRR